MSVRKMDASYNVRMNASVGDGGVGNKTPLRMELSCG